MIYTSPVPKQHSVGETFLYEVQSCISTASATLCCFLLTCHCPTLPPKLWHCILTSSRQDTPGSFCSSEITSSIAFCIAMKSWSSAVSNCNLKWHDSFSTTMSDQQSNAFTANTWWVFSKPHQRSYWGYTHIFKGIQSLLDI